MYKQQFQTVGLITDIHYDGSAIAMNRLYEAVTILTRGGVNALVVMGDLVNGKSADHARRLLREVAALCEAFSGSTTYMPGNHDLDHLSKAEFYEALGRTGEKALFTLTLGDYRLISIDGNYSPDGTEYERGNFNWKEACIPSEQLRTLRMQIEEKGTPVILFSHQRVDHTTEFSVRNAAAVREVIRETGKVKAVIQGHQHADQLQMIEGTTYYTLSAHVDNAGPAVVEIEPQGVRLIRDFQPSLTA